MPGLLEILPYLVWMVAVRSDWCKDLVIIVDAEGGLQLSCADCTGGGSGCGWCGTTQTCIESSSSCGQNVSIGSRFSDVCRDLLVIHPNASVWKTLSTQVVLDHAMWHRIVIGAERQELSFVLQRDHVIEWVKSIQISNALSQMLPHRTVPSLVCLQQPFGWSQLASSWYCLLAQSLLSDHGGTNDRKTNHRKRIHPTIGPSDWFWHTEADDHNFVN